MPCGLKPSRGRLGRQFLEQRSGAEVVGDEVQAAIEFGNAAGGSAGSRAHLGNQETAFGQGEEVVRNARVESFGGHQEPRMPWVGDVKKEDAILALEHAQQSAATQDPFVCGKMAMVRLIADISRRRKRHGP